MSAKWLDQFVTQKTPAASAPVKSTNRFAALATDESAAKPKKMPIAPPKAAKIVDISSNTMFPVLSPLTAVPGPVLVPGKSSFATIAASVPIAKPPPKEEVLVKVASEHTNLGITVVSDDWGDYAVAAAPAPVKHTAPVAPPRVEDDVW